MSNWAQDQADFMWASGQTVHKLNEHQLTLYAKLIHEEINEELFPAIVDLESCQYPDGDYLNKCDPGHLNEINRRAAIVADGAIDGIVVLLGLLHSIGIDPEKAWQEVHRTNMSKIDPATGKVRKREDGKILKPEGWQPPDMVRVVKESWGLV